MSSKSKKKRLTQEQLEDLCDDVIRKQQELIKMHEIEIEKLKAELRAQQNENNWNIINAEHYARLKAILGCNFPFDSFGSMPKF